jgi:BolA protein
MAKKTSSKSSSKKANKTKPKSKAKPKVKVSKAKKSLLKRTTESSGRKALSIKPQQKKKKSSDINLTVGTLQDDPVAQEILTTIRTALTPLTALIRNLSKGHQNHSEKQKHGGGHYSLHVVSESFRGLALKDRQRWIHALLENFFAQKKIHALELELKDETEASRFTK